MELKIFGLEEFCDIEKDLCSIHKVPEENETIGHEWADIKRRFVEGLGGSFKVDEDYEFLDGHHNIQLFWIYLYTERLYSPTLLDAICAAIAPYDDHWFAQCECYSDQPVPDGGEVNSIGEFIVHKNTVLVSESAAWPMYIPKLGLALPS